MASTRALQKQKVKSDWCTDRFLCPVPEQEIAFLFVNILLHLEEFLRESRLRGEQHITHNGTTRQFRLWRRTACSTD